MIRKTARLINNILFKYGIEIKKHQTKDYLYPKLYSADVLLEKPFYNVGAGSFSHPYWTNIDYSSSWYGGVQKNILHYDLMALTPLPIKDKSAELIYTSHTVEHVSEAAVMNLFKESYRSLKKGGGLRVTTGPDAESDFRALKNLDEDWFYWDKMYEKPGTYEDQYLNPATSVPVEERWLRHVASQLAANDFSPSKTKFTAEQIREIIKAKGFDESLNYFTGLCEFNPKRPGNHISWWTHSKLEKFLREAGFKTIYRSGYGQSAFGVLRDLRYFDNTHPQISVYVEAIKD